MAAEYRYTSQPHPCFPQPADPDAVLWRYMDLAKLVSTLSTRKLFFPCVDLMDDPFEGSTSKPTREAEAKRRLDVYGSDDPLAADRVVRDVASFADRQKFDRQCTAISCWHMNGQESAAMWKLYLSASEGIALKTTFRKLVSSFPQAGEGFNGPGVILAGMVQYIDYERDLMPAGNAYYPFMHKRLSFEHEREVRAVIYELVQWPIRDGSGKLKAPFAEGGVAIPVELGVMVDEIRVSPSSPPWFRKAVAAVCERFELDRPVRQSDLLTDPVF